MKVGAALPLLAICLTPTGPGLAGEDVPDRSAPSRSFEITYVTHVKNIPTDAKQLRLWIPVPQSNTHQRITQLEIESPFKYELTQESVYGNKMVYLSVDKPPTRVDVMARYTVARLENGKRAGYDTNGDAKQAALRSGKLNPISPDIREMAQKIAKQAASPTQRARAFYDYIIDEMTYSKKPQQWERGNFRRTCDVRTGNCTDFNAVFVGLCRNVDIPAYIVFGLPIPHARDQGTAPAYHCWACFWNGTGWVPLDIAEAEKQPDRKEYCFGNVCENRIRLSVGRDITLAPPQQSQPLNYFVYPYAEIDGQPHPRVSKTSRYKNIPGTNASE